MAGAQQVGGIDEGLAGKERQGLASHFDDAPALERAERHVIAGELAVGRIIRAEREELVIGGIAHASLRGAILPHKSPILHPRQATLSLAKLVERHDLGFLPRRRFWR